MPSTAAAPVKEEVFTDGAPLPIGIYSQAVKAGNLVFLSAQAPISPVSNTVEREDFEGQLRQSLSNLAAVATSAGGDLGNVVKVTAFITDFANFPTLNAVMEEFFPKPYPARTTAEVARLPRNTLIAIEAIMAL